MAKFNARLHAVLICHCRRLAKTNVGDTVCMRSAICLSSSPLKTNISQLMLSQTEPNESVYSEEAFFFFFHLIKKEEAGRFIWSWAALPLALLSTNCLSMWRVLRERSEALPHFNNQRLCQWQLLWLFWNSERGVSGAHIDSKCDSSCPCGIRVLMIGQLIEWSVSSRFTLSRVSSCWTIVDQSYFCRYMK